MFKKQIGVFGMSVMGRNLALNIESRGYTVSIFNRSRNKTDDVIFKNRKKSLTPYYNIKEFIESLKPPRCIFMMVQAGIATDKIIHSLIPHLYKGDILIDGGNSYYKDTARRSKALSNLGFHFIGAGISGGGHGALKGPAIMPGGHKESYELVAPFLKKIAAVVQGEPCVSYIGSGGAGHYVKMVHNGIEYGDMQLIAESYALLKQALNLTNKQLSEIFCEWNQGELSSYLIDITKDIFLKKDVEGNYLIDVILDEAGSKGTGKWTIQSALDLNEPLSIITESLFSRYLSSLKSERILASKMLYGPNSAVFIGEKSKFIKKVHHALYFSKIISYAQGFSQLKAASKENKWDLHYNEIAKIFRGGCIIRAKFLQNIIDAYITDPALSNLLLAPYFRQVAAVYQPALRDVVSYAVQMGIPIPAFSSAISYYDSYRTAVLPANLIQAQRDYFGSHTYKRIDKEGTFHTEWI